MKKIICFIMFLPTLGFGQRFGSTLSSADISLSSNTILNQSTIQTGTTAYPDFLYVGTSATVGPSGLRVLGVLDVGNTATGFSEHSRLSFDPSANNPRLFIYSNRNTASDTGEIDWVSNAGTTVGAINSSLTGLLTVSKGAGLAVTYGAVFGSATVSNLTAGQCVQTGTGGLLTVTGSACSAGGGGGASTLAVTTGTLAGWTNVPQSSPTAVINFDQSQVAVSLQGGATAFITIQAGVATPTANYTIGSSVTVVLANCGASCTITLPTAVGITGRILRVKVVGTGVTTIGTTSAQTIDGSSTLTPSPNQWADIDISSDGANWNIL